MADKIDLLKRWFAMKARIIQKQGPYTFADGTIARIENRGQPLTTYAQAQALADVWIKTANKMAKDLQERNKPSGPVIQEISIFIQRQADWFLSMSETYGSNRSGFKGKYLFMPAADEFYQNLGFFISHVNAATNWSLDSKTEWELLGEAIDETAGGFLIKPFYYGVQGTAAAVEVAQNMIAGAPELFNDIGSAIETLTKIVKWGSIAGGLYLLYGALKPKKAK